MEATKRLDILLKVYNFNKIENLEHFPLTNLIIADSNDLPINLTEICVSIGFLVSHCMTLHKKFFKDINDLTLP